MFAFADSSPERHLLVDLRRLLYWPFSANRLSGSGMDLTGDWTITVTDVFEGDCFMSSVRHD